jgi:hypothetical protein
LRSITMPVRAIAKQRYRAIFEPPGKGERAMPNPNLSRRPEIDGGLAISAIALQRAV